MRPAFPKFATSGKSFVFKGFEGLVIQSGDPG